MLSSIVKLFVSGVIVVLVFCASPSRADATVFRDRASFNALQIIPPTAVGG